MDTYVDNDSIKRQITEIRVFQERLFIVAFCMLYHA